MLISHESPLELLEDSLIYNDYEYALLHLTHIPEYREFYRKVSLMGRTVYLDNSAYEYQFIDGGFNMDYFIEACNFIKPSHIIIPDVIANCDITCKNVDEFPYGKIEYEAKYIGVVQGENIKELEKCFDFMNNHQKVEIVALVFHSPAYQLNNGNSKDYENMMGRFNFFNNIKSKLKKKVHLLGCSLPKEFTMYNNDIYSIDTAAPVQWGVLGKQFSIEVKEKPNCILSEDVIKSPMENKSLIIKNISDFRKIIKSKG